MINSFDVRLRADLVYRMDTGNDSVPKIIVNNTKNIFLNCNQHFADFKP